MAACLPTRLLQGAVLCAGAFVWSGTAAAQILPWEINVAEIEAGRIRGLAERLSKENLLFQLHLTDVRKSDIVATAARIDRILESLEQGSPSYSIPAPWTPELRRQLAEVSRVWGPLRRIAFASPYDYFRVTQKFLPPDSRRGDPLLIRYFDELSLDLIAESEKLLELYHAQCVATGLEVCATSRTSGYAAMVIERAAKEAVFVVAGIEPAKSRKRLDATIEAYQAIRRANDENPFFAEALDPSRGVSAQAAGELLASLRRDWDSMETEFAILEAGDQENFDLRRLLEVQSRLVDKVERLTAALVRYASQAYGS